MVCHVTVQLTGSTGNELFYGGLAGYGDNCLPSEIDYSTTGPITPIDISGLKEILITYADLLGNDYVILWK